MRKRTAVVAVIAMTLTLLSTSPVAAEKAFRGWSESSFNYAGFGVPETPCPQVSWAGTIDIDGELYAIWFEPTAPLQFIGDGVFFHEIWRIGELGSVAIADGVVSVCDGPGLMWGYDRGKVGPAGFAAAQGSVAWADENGPFAGLAGHAVSWSGQIAASGVDFAGPFHVR